MKKYLLPLILILILSFALAGDCVDWLPGWDLRIKLTVQDADIDTANLTWFPVTVHLTGAQAEEIFTELDADADYMKVAFTKADGTTELYAENEIFNQAGSLATYHVSRDGWVIAYDANTDFYMYYDNNHADNTTYIGTINTTPGAAVWDGDFIFVSHQKDATTSTVLDSTSNNNDGTKKGANEPVSIAGQVSTAQDYDGTDDMIDHAATSGLDAATLLTVEAYINPDANTTYAGVVQRGSTAFVNGVFRLEQGLYAENNSSFTVQEVVSHTSKIAFNDVVVLNNGTWYYVYGLATATQVRCGVDLVEDTPVEYDGLDPLVTGSTHYYDKLFTGDYYYDATPTHYYFNGQIDEVRVSDVARANEWLKATYNSLKDSLLTYGSEEEAPTDNAIMFGMNF